jgi:hypothetical protein
MLLLPIGYVAVAVALVQLHHLARRLAPRTWLADLGGLAVMAALVVSPLQMLNSYYLHAEQDGRTNRALFAAVEAIIQAGPSDGPILLDAGLDRELTLSGGTLLRNAELLLELRRQPYQVVDLDNQQPISGPTRLLLRANGLSDLYSRYIVRPLPGDPANGIRLRAVTAWPPG